MTERPTDPTPEAQRIWRLCMDGCPLSVIQRAVDEITKAAVERERERIAQRVSERCILRLQVGRDPLEEANEIIQDLAHDIETDWADYEDDGP